jgi:hypothetical protein
MGTSRGRTKVLIASETAEGERVEVEVTSPVFVDPKGQRIHV